MSACNFVSSFLDNGRALLTEEDQKLAREDVKIIDFSLHFINDLLRNSKFVIPSDILPSLHSCRVLLTLAYAQCSTYIERVVGSFS